VLVDAVVIETLEQLTGDEFEIVDRTPDHMTSGWGNINDDV
jgi:hypothetical protein